MADVADHGDDFALIVFSQPRDDDGGVETSGIGENDTLAQISAVLKKARRRDIPAKAAAIQQTLRGEHLGQADVVATAYAATVRSAVAVLQVLNAEIKTLEGQVEAHFGQHPDAEVYLSQPGIGAVLGARVLAEFGDASGRYADAKSRKNYAGTAPITRQSGKTKTVHARFIHNDRLIDALHMQAGAATLRYHRALPRWRRATSRRRPTRETRYERVRRRTTSPRGGGRPPRDGGGTGGRGPPPGPERRRR